MNRVKGGVLGSRRLIDSTQLSHEINKRRDASVHADGLKRNLVERREVNLQEIFMYP
jgi:hypothetical protein